VHLGFELFEKVSQWAVIDRPTAAAQLKDGPGAEK
jgi:hypothetical protein